MPEFGDTAKFPAALAARSDVGHPMDNFAQFTLNGAISAVVLSLVVNETVPTFTPQAGWLTIDTEVVHYNAWATKTFTIDIRGDQGSVATTHNSAAIVGRYMTKQEINQAIAEIIAVEAWLGASTAIASAATTDLATLTGAYAQVTGTTTITAFGTLPRGRVVLLQFAGILTLTHNATSLIIRSGSSAVTAVGDIYAFVSEGAGNWRELFHTIAAITTNVQVFTATGANTWTKPAGAKHVRVFLWGGGGGGGGGEGRAVANFRAGGGGGGGAGYTERAFDPSVLGATETATVGVGGVSGAAGTGANSLAGGTGGTSSFGTHAFAYGAGGGGPSVTGNGGPGGGGGAPLTAGTVGGSSVTTTGGNGGAAINGAGGATGAGGGAGIAEGGGGGGGTGANGGPTTDGGAGGGAGGANSTAGIAAGQAVRGAGGGGGGGAVNNANTEAIGGVGGLSGGTTTFITGGGGTAGAVTGGVGGVGTSRTGTIKAADGGGGGGGSNVGTGGAGGAGGAPGGGGGGGGGGTNVGGVGGLGGRGEVIVVTLF